MDQQPHIEQPLCEEKIKLINSSLQIIAKEIVQTDASSRKVVSKMYVFRMHHMPTNIRHYVAQCSWWCYTDSPKYWHHKVFFIGVDFNGESHDVQHGLPKTLNDLLMKTATYNIRNFGV